MKQTKLQLDDSTYELLSQRAKEQGISISDLVQQVLQNYLGATWLGPRKVQDFGFIGAGASKESKFDPISERHDEALAEDDIN